VLVGAYRECALRRWSRRPVAHFSNRTRECAVLRNRWDEASHDAPEAAVPRERALKEGSESSMTTVAASACCRASVDLGDRDVEQLVQ
jgi:hypothetical protein